MLIMATELPSAMGLISDCGMNVSSVQATSTERKHRNGKCLKVFMEYLFVFLSHNYLGCNLVKKSYFEVLKPLKYIKKDS